jgi:hypothetical protein
MRGHFLLQKVKHNRDKAITDLYLSFVRLRG